MRRFLLSIFILCSFVLSPTVSWADGPATPEFTLQQAVEKAKQNSEALKSAGYDIDRGYEVRKYAADKVKYIPTGPTSGTAANAYKGLIQADMNWDSSKRNYTVQEDTVVMQTYQAYDGLLLALGKVKVAEAQVKSDDLQRIVVDANVRVGIKSKADLIQAEATFKNAKAALETANKDLDDSYQKFNQLLGLQPDDRPVLVEKPKLDELKVASVDAYIDRVIDDIPAVWQAQDALELAKISSNLYDFTSTQNSDPHYAKEIDISKAELSVSSAKEQIQKSLRTLYYSIKKQEEQYVGAQENVKSAEEALRVIKVKYDVGIATRSEVAAAELKLSQAEQSILDLSCQHNISTLTFQKPWTT